MIKRFFSDRLNILKLIILFILVVMIFRLADLQIVKGEYYRIKSDTIRTRNIPVTAPRGKIVDKFGRVIADNKQSYSVIMVKTDVSEEKLNDVALSIANILESNGDKYKDEVPILLNPIRFSYYDKESDWKNKYNIPQEASAKAAFERLREEYNINSDVVDVDAYNTLTDNFDLDLPFNVSDFVFSYKKEENKWKQKNGFEESTEAEGVLTKLLQNYVIPFEKYGFDDGKKILAIKYLIKQKQYKTYEPVEIAINVKEETRAIIEESKIFLDGVEILEKPLRKYPNGDFAAHIIGYMGKIGAEMDEMIKKGYNPSDLIGKSGIEYSMEQYLKGKDGVKQIEVDVRGSLVNTIDVQNPEPGDTVFLTIDTKLQQVAEQALADTMQKINKGKTSAAAVAIDINSGAILAIASAPKYDPNLFSAGIKTEDWESLQPKSEDRYAPKPLINNAISSPLPPGSTMKMVTITAGLNEGKISPTELVYCTGRYTVVPNVAPRDAHGSVHGSTSTIKALMVSCNYYFFEVGRRIGGETFEKYADKFGFGKYSGIELPFEAKGSVQGPEHKKALYKYYTEKYLQSHVAQLDDKGKEEIYGFIYNNPGERNMRNRLKEMGVTESNDVNKIVDYVRNSRWQPGDVLNSAIGQGMNNVTPLQLASYVATVVNGGTRYKPHLVEKIISSSGEIVLEKKSEVVEKINISALNTQTIKKGMYDVINGSGGTARGLFAGTGIEAGGKTGTAQAGKYRPDPKNNPNYYVEYQDHSWFVAFAPYDKPQIAVAAVVFQGGYGSGAAPIAREIIKQYLTPIEVKDSIVQQNELIQ